MRNLLFVVILGLLAFVHSTPLTTVTQISAKAEEEVLNEAVTDGFLIDIPSLTTVSPKRNTTVPVSQPPSSVPTERDFEGSASGESIDLFHQHEGEHPTTTTQSVSHAPSSTSTVFLRVQDHSSLDSSSTQSSGESSDLFHQHEGEHPATTTQSVSQAPSSTSTVFLRAVDHSSSDLSITQSTQASFKSSSVPNEAQPSSTPDHKSTSQTTHHAVLGFDPLSSDLGSGSGEMPEQHTTTTSIMKSNTNRVTDAASSTTMAAPISANKAPRLFVGDDKSATEAGTAEKSTMTEVPVEPQPTKSDIDVTVQKEVLNKTNNEPQTGPAGSNKGHKTPGWMIIVGFIVGVAALVVICIAIATRDKWNAPSKASQLETQDNSTNQQRGQEMETFLPKENGKAAEYTVIPLEELPEKDSSD